MYVIQIVYFAFKWLYVEIINLFRIFHLPLNSVTLNLLADYKNDLIGRDFVSLMVNVYFTESP